MLGEVRAWLLEREFALWTAAGRRPQLWWRDDDARSASPALSRLLDLAGDSPIALAVVPDGNPSLLRRELNGRANIAISQHGFDHQNNRRPDEPVGEYPLGASAEIIGQRVCSGRRRLEDAGLMPLFYTPPWNRIDSNLPQALHSAGFKALSSWGELSAQQGDLRRVDAHVDVLRWNPRPGFRGRGRFFVDLRRQLRGRRKAERWGEAIGMLTHHLDHDDETWRFLAGFLQTYRGHFEWPGIGDLMPPFSAAAPPQAKAVINWRNTLAMIRP